MHGPLFRWLLPAHGDHAILHGMADWDAVRFFLELARAKTLARAARTLRVDYTTVGRRVSAFERELGAKLFERTPDGFVLTDAGREHPRRRRANGAVCRCRRAARARR